MFAGQRDFRAIVFTSKLKSVSEVINLMPREDIAAGTITVDSSTQSQPILHGYFYSETPYADPAKLVNIRVPYFGVERYRYDFYGCEFRIGRSLLIAIAVPFAEMATEMFGPIDQASRSFKRKYKKVDLQKLALQLQDGGELASEFVATTARFRLDGGDSVHAVEMTGRDVFASQFILRTVENLRGLELVPRRVRMRSTADQRRLVFEVDSHGNYWMRVAKNGANLGTFGYVLALMDKCGVLQDTLDYPLRQGVRSDDDDNC